MLPPLHRKSTVETSQAQETPHSRPPPGGQDPRSALCCLRQHHTETSEHLSHDSSERAGKPCAHGEVPAVCVGGPEPMGPGWCIRPVSPCVAWRWGPVLPLGGGAPSALRPPGGRLGSVHSHPQAALVQASPTPWLWTSPGLHGPSAECRVSPSSPQPSLPDDILR